MLSSYQKQVIKKFPCGELTCLSDYRKIQMIRGDAAVFSAQYGTFYLPLFLKFSYSQ